MEGGGEEEEEMGGGGEGRDSNLTVSGVALGSGRSES